eukprot:49637-Amphidinium_carterae.1
MASQDHIAGGGYHVVKKVFERLYRTEYKDSCSQPPAIQTREQRLRQSLAAEKRGRSRSTCKLP